MPTWDQRSMMTEWNQKCMLDAEIAAQLRALFPLEAVPGCIASAFERGLAEMLGDVVGEKPCTTAATGQDQGGLTLDVLYESIKKAGLLEPHAQAIWFIDRYAEFRQFEQLMGDLLDPPEYYDLSMIGADRAIYGFPVRVWSLRDITERIAELLAQEFPKHIPFSQLQQIVERSFPFRRPGVFVEMSDGNHLEIVLDRSGGGE